MTLVYSGAKALGPHSCRTEVLDPYGSWAIFLVSQAECEDTPLKMIYFLLLHPQHLAFPKKILVVPAGSMIHVWVSVFGTAWVAYLWCPFIATNTTVSDQQNSILNFELEKGKWEACSPFWTSRHIIYFFIFLIILQWNFIILFYRWGKLVLKNLYHVKK